MTKRGWGDNAWTGRSLRELQRHVERLQDWNYNDSYEQNLDRRRWKEKKNRMKNEYWVQEPQWLSNSSAGTLQINGQWISSGTTNAMPVTGYVPEVSDDPLSWLDREVDSVRAKAFA